MLLDKYNRNQILGFNSETISCSWKNKLKTGWGNMMNTLSVFHGFKTALDACFALTLNCRWNNISIDCNFNIHCCESLKYHIKL